MIKADVVKSGSTTKVYFETNNVSTEGLDELDEIYQAILGSAPKRGGYVDSNKFYVEVNNE